MSLKEVSKYMSLILRHKPDVVGITLDEHGWANVDELIAGIAKDNEFIRDIQFQLMLNWKNWCPQKYCGMVPGKNMSPQ